MALQYSVTIRNNQLDAVENTILSSPKLQIRTGPPPANCAAAASGTILIQMSLPANWMNIASGGMKTLLGLWSGTGIANGTAGHFRVYDNSLSTCHIQGTVTGTGGGGDMELTSTNINVLELVVIHGFTLTAQNA